jgi:DNA adenine methylase
VESFGGAASVLLRKPRSYGEVYNDLDREIVNLFRILRNPAQAGELIRLVKLTPFAHDEFDLSYIAADDPIEQARRTVARAFMGFGSAAATGHQTGFRANSNRSGTTPAHDWMNYPDKLIAIVERLRGVVIENKDAIEVIRQQDGPKTLHYVDPPYLMDTRSQKSRRSPLYRHEMTEDDHRELAAVLHSVKGMVIISGYPCDLYDRELYLDWRCVTCKALADGARERIEALWISPAADKVMLPMFA